MPPSARKKTASNTRPPSPRCSSDTPISRARFSRTASRLSVAARGSGKCCPAVQSGAGRRGVRRMSSCPRMRFNLVTSSMPKRADSVLDGRLARSHKVLRPARVRATVVSVPASRAVTGSRRAAFSSSPGEAMATALNRANARAESGVLEIVARAESPRLENFRRACSRNFSSPPKRCAQPVMSSRRPSCPSSAVSGVKISQHAARSRRKAASADSFTASTRSNGTRARASVSESPGRNPNCVAC